MGNTFQSSMTPASLELEGHVKLRSRIFYAVEKGKDGQDLLRRCDGRLLEKDYPLMNMVHKVEEKDNILGSGGLENFMI